MLLQAVANIGTDSAAIIPESMLIEFTESKNVAANGELYERAVDHIDNAVSKAVLTTQMPRGGASLAAAKVHDGVRRDILAADARRLSQTITHQLVKPMVDLTFGVQAVYPRSWLGLPADQDIKTFADVIAEVVDHGLEVGQDYVLDMLGIPAPAAGEAVLRPRTMLSGRVGADDPGADDVGQNRRISAEILDADARTGAFFLPIQRGRAARAGRAVNKNRGRLDWSRY